MCLKFQEEEEEEEEDFNLEWPLFYTQKNGRFIEKEKNKYCNYYGSNLP
jgi:hypothetical protein